MKKVRVGVIDAVVFFYPLVFLPWENINQTVACGILDFNFLIQYPKGLILSFQNIN